MVTQLKGLEAVARRGSVTEAAGPVALSRGLNKAGFVIGAAARVLQV